MSVSTSSSKSIPSSTSSSYQPSSNNDDYEVNSSCSEENKSKQKAVKNNALTLTRYFISTRPKSYIGLREEFMWLIDLLHSFTKCDVDDIRMTLMKIKTNDTFERLGDQFGRSTSKASGILKKIVKPVAACLKALTFFPDSKNIKLNLPIAFRANYSHVCATLYGFEIEIEKPSDSEDQALSWSEYKHCNTLKFLVTSTPDGFIISTSIGYGGRISDTLLFEELNILEVLPEGCGIRADRGFKPIQTILNEKNCELIRPPSVPTSEQLKKPESKESKRIASLRIIIERVIRRIREFKLLVPHSCLDPHMMDYVDDIVVIVAGLINLQNPIIKK